MKKEKMLRKIYRTQVNESINKAMESVTKKFLLQRNILFFVALAEAAVFITALIIFKVGK